MTRIIFLRTSALLILNFITFSFTANADDAMPSGLHGHGSLQSVDISLMQAIEKGDLPLVKKLINEGASINVELFNGMTPIHQAAMSGHFDIVHYLLDSGADVNSKMANGITPLFIAVESQNPDVIKLLLSKDAQYTEREVNLAFIRDNLEIVKLLVTSSQLANLQGRNGITLLHDAALAGKSTIVQYLIAQGAKLDAKTNDGETALDMAIKNKEHLTGLLARGITHDQLLAQGFNYDGYDAVIALIEKHRNKQ